MNGAKKGVRYLGCIVMIMALLLSMMSVAVPETARAATDVDAVWADCESKINFLDNVPGADGNALIPWNGMKAASQKPIDDAELREIETNKKACIVRTPEGLRWALENTASQKITLIDIQRDMDMGGREDAAQTKKWTPVNLTSELEITGNGHRFYNLDIDGRGFIGDFNKALKVTYQIY